MDEVGGLMRRGRLGDQAAYLAALQALRIDIEHCVDAHAPAASERELIVQAILMAVHAKRATWDERDCVHAWAEAIARYRLRYPKVGDPHARLRKH